MSMPHLDDAQMLDAVDGRADADAVSHLAACGSCRARVDELRTVMLTVGDADVPEPSPLFWDHFPVRVSRAIDASPQPRAWQSASRWLWGSASAAGVVVVMLLLPMRRDVAAPAPAPQVSDAAISAAVEPAPEDYESDEAWAMVRAVAEDVDYDEVQEVGLTPRAGSVESAAMDLTAAERAELARLIEQDSRLTKERLKRTGASTP